MKNLLKDVAEYGNVSWRGFFTEAELCRMEEDYLAELIESSRLGAFTPAVDSLCKRLVEDAENGSKEATVFLERIKGFVVKKEVLK